MDNTAIQAIQESANIPELIKQVTSPTDIAAVAVMPEGMTVVNLEKFMPTANRYHLNYATNNISDFGAYNVDFQDPDAICFIKSDTMSAKTIFDIGNTDAPGHKDHTARISLDKSAAFHAICIINGRTMAQKDASDLIEDWADKITATNTDGDSMTAAQAASSLRDLTIESAKELNSKVGDFGASMSAMEKIEAKNQATLPAVLNFKCIPYNGLKERTFQLRVAILTSGEKPALCIRILQLEAINEEMTDEFKGILIDKLKETEIKAYIGET